MKAIKIASGVAISALAAAISAQAHAEGDTEFSWSAVGSMEAMFVYDFEGETKDVDLDEEDDFDSATAGEAWGLEVTHTITHGPFSGNIVFTIDDGEYDYDIEDLIVTDGAISFGQVGSLVDATPAYVYDMDDSEDLNSESFEDSKPQIAAAVGDLDEGADVGAGIRYTMGGLKVQIEGLNDYVVDEDRGFGTGAADGFEDDLDDDGDNEKIVTDYGVAASYMGEMDALSYVVEAQVRASDDALDSADPYYYIGAGATYTMDMVEVGVGVNQYTVADVVDDGVADGKKAAVLEYGFAVTVTPVEAASLYVKGTDWDAGNYFADYEDDFTNEVQSGDTAKFLFGAAYTVDVYTVTGEYLFTTAEESGDEVFVELAYADGAIGAYGSVTLEDFDADTAHAPLFEAGASYTQDSGVMYAVDYDFQAEGDEVGGTAVNSAVNTLKVGASYAF